MTDKEIVQKLLEHDERVTHWFFHEQCRPLFLSIMRLAFDYPVDYDEIVNEIYLLLMEEDGKRLRQFDFRSSIYQWMKIVTLRHLVNHSARMIDDKSKESPYKSERAHTCVSLSSAHVDILSLLDQMDNRRFAYVIQTLVLEDREPRSVADELKVTVANLYNIKKRAIAALTLLVVADKKLYNHEKDN